MMNHFVRVTGAALLIAVLLAASGYAPAPPVRAHAYQAGTNCAVSPFMLFGQRASIVKVGSSSGGLNAVSPNLVSDHLWFEERGYNQIGYEFQPVTIIMLDDFSVYDGNAGLSYPTSTSHGYFVGEMLNSWYMQMMQDRNGYQLQRESMIEQMVMMAAGGEPMDIPIVRITAVDYSGQNFGTNEELDRAYQTGYLSDKLLQRLGEIGGGRVILNMSFVIFACDGVDMMDFFWGHRENPDYSLVDYLGWEDVLNRLNDAAYRGDPLRDLLNQFTAGEYLQKAPSGLVLAGNVPRQSFELAVPVAAAGNYGSSSGPFAPGSWDNVISVGAGQGNSATNLWPDSTPGEITVPGAYFSVPGTDNYVGGTSFAAPGASLLLAFDLAKNYPACQPKGNIPALALKDTYNMDFMSAYYEYCQG